MSEEAVPTTDVPTTDVPTTDVPTTDDSVIEAAVARAKELAEDSASKKRSAPTEAANSEAEPQAKRARAGEDDASAVVADPAAAMAAAQAAMAAAQSAAAAAAAAAAGGEQPSGAAAVVETLGAAAAASAGASAHLTAPMRGSTGSNRAPMAFNRLAGDAAPGSSGYTNGMVPMGEGVGEVMIPNDRVGLVIGRGGETIKFIQATSGCHVQIQKENEMLPGQTQRKITLKGTPQQIEMATQIVQQKTSQGGALGGGGGGGGGHQGGALSLDVKIPNDRAGTVIGRGGMTIKTIQAKNRVNVQIPKMADRDDPIHRTITISGHSEADLQNAKNEIAAVLMNASNMHVNGSAVQPTGGQTKTIYVPGKEIGAIIGSRGNTIKSIQQSTGCSLQIPRDQNGTFFTFQYCLLTSVACIDKSSSFMCR